MIKNFFPFIFMLSIGLVAAPWVKVADSATVKKLKITEAAIDTFTNDSLVFINGGVIRKASTCAKTFPPEYHLHNAATLPDSLKHHVTPLHIPVAKDSLHWKTLIGAKGDTVYGDVFFNRNFYLGDTTTGVLSLYMGALGTYGDVELDRTSLYISSYGGGVAARGGYLVLGGNNTISGGFSLIAGDSGDGLVASQWNKKTVLAGGSLDFDLSYEGGSSIDDGLRLNWNNVSHDGFHLFSRDTTKYIRISQAFTTGSSSEWKRTKFSSSADTITEACSLGLFTGDYYISGNLLVKSNTTDSVKVDSTGVHLYGEATQWDDCNFPIASLKGNNVPEPRQVGTTHFYMPAFSNLRTEGVWGVLEVPHGKKIGGYTKSDSVQFHMHLAPEIADSGHYKFILYYRKTYDGQLISIEDSSIVVTKSDSVAYQSKTINFDWIRTDVLGTRILFAVDRVPLDPADTYAGFIYSGLIGFHYASDAFGSNEMTVK